jgi:hypothetical protein
MEWLYLKLCVILSLTAAGLNVIAIAAEAPWYARPVSIVAWLLRDYVNTAIEAAGRVVGNVYVIVARQLSLMLERLWPAIKETLVDTWFILLEWLFTIQSFLRGTMTAMEASIAARLMIDPMWIAAIVNIGGVFMLADLAIWYLMPRFREDLLQSMEQRIQQEPVLEEDVTVEQRMQQEPVLEEDVTVKPRRRIRIVD